MKIATHSGRFHTDDVFAVAALLLLYPDAEVLRSRDKEVLQSADIVVDVGMSHDPSVGRFDHHQPGGAGVRENGIPYASFGLIWKEYGRAICGSQDVVNLVEETMVLHIDAVDNGVSVSRHLYDRLNQFCIQDVIESFLPENDNISPDTAFSEAVRFAQAILRREIASAKTEVADKLELLALARRSPNNPILVLPRVMRGKDVLIDFPGIFYVVSPGRKAWGDDNWYVKAVRKSHEGFENKKPLPAAWAGKEGNELAQLAGVADAVFCHRGRFLAAAKSKEGALALAERALNA